MSGFFFKADNRKETENEKIYRQSERRRKDKLKRSMKKWGKIMYGKNREGFKQIKKIL